MVNGLFFQWFYHKKISKDVIIHLIKILPLITNTAQNLTKAWDWFRYFGSKYSKHSSKAKTTFLENSTTEILSYIVIK